MVDNPYAKRVRERKTKIRTWEKMKAKLNARFLSPTSVKDWYSPLHHLTQGNFSLEEYTHEFQKLVIKCDLQESEEQPSDRYIRGLNPWYANVVYLQAYTSFADASVLAHKVKQ